MSNSDPNDLPPSFWMNSTLEAEHTRRGPPQTTGTGHWKPMSGLMWYDDIIDDILGHPGTTMKDTAKRLGRAATTICAIVSSDLFKARWAQRREQFNRALDERLTRKLASVAEKSLDITLEVLDQKRDSIPLPVLNETVKNSLDRLGYGPSPPTAPAVVVNNNVVSAEALAKARDSLRTIERTSIEGTAQRASFPDSAGSPVEGEGEDGAAEE